MLGKQGHQGEHAALPLVVIAQHDQHVLQRNGKRDGPENERQHAENCFRPREGFSAGHETGAQCIERTGTDITEHYPKRGKRQLGHRFTGVLRVHGCLRGEGR